MQIAWGAPMPRCTAAAANHPAALPQPSAGSGSSMCRRAASSATRLSKLRWPGEQCSTPLKLCAGLQPLLASLPLRT